jgi:hypothetical protein
MTLKECAQIDKDLVNVYHYRLKYMSSDAKHTIFISNKYGGIGVRSFTGEYVGALLRDLEVYISDSSSITAHALISSIEAAVKQSCWSLYKNGKIPKGSNAENRLSQTKISGKKTLFYQDDEEIPFKEEISYDHIYTMEKAIRTTSALGFILRDLNHELCSRFIDELLLNDRNAKAVANLQIKTRSNMNACLGEGNQHFYKYSLVGHIYIYILIQIILEEARKKLDLNIDENVNDGMERILLRPTFYGQINCFPKEISALKLASTAINCIKKFKNDYKLGSFHQLMEWRFCIEDLDKTIHNIHVQKNLLQL